MAERTRGFCKYCGKDYTKSGMIRHFMSCGERKKYLEAEHGTKSCGYFLVVISDKYQKDYWLIVEINENARLKELDQFIRDIWVECCGHLSEFAIQGVRYESEPSEDFWGRTVHKSMNVRLKNVFAPGVIAEYMYDYGSTTSLTLEVKSYRAGAEGQEKITILSRNNPIKILCSQCEKNTAEWVNPLAFYDQNPFWCMECMRKEVMKDMEPDEAAEMDDDDILDCFEIWLPVCNSPRMGVCGYTGSSKYPDQFLPKKKKKT